MDDRAFDRLHLSVTDEEKAVKEGQDVGEASKKKQGWHGMAPFQVHPRNLEAKNVRSLYTGTCHKSPNHSCRIRYDDQAQLPYAMRR